MRMRIINKMLFVVITMIIFTACAPLKTPVVMKYASIEKYKYAYIIPTKELTSSSGGTFGGMYGIYGLSTTKSVNPSDVISGILIKEGFIILPELKSELSHETIVVNYGEIGKRARGLGHTMEIIIQFISADTNELLFSSFLLTLMNCYVPVPVKDKEKQMLMIFVRLLIMHCRVCFLNIMIISFKLVS